MAGSQELFDFLEDAELSQYYDPLVEVLKIASVQHLKYVEEDDLTSIGMSRPEIRRLKKNYKKVSSQSTFGKMRKILGKSNTDNIGIGSKSPSLQRQKPQGKPGSRHIIPEDAITTSLTLGGGEFGTVEQGIWIDGDGNKIQVAVKSLSQKRIQSGMTDFLKEASIMHSIDHDNIVRLYGVVLGTETYMLVTELAPLRSLLECLKNEALQDTFPVCQLCDFTIQIADGMSYLENKRMIHRDLAARNILVFDKDTVKVSDFGLSRALGVGSDYYQCNMDGNLKLPIAWCAPETINYLRFTSASDVWAYGVTLWEIFSYGQQPWALLTGEQILAAVDLPEKERLELPDYCPVDIYDIMLKCWAHEPEDRPRFLDILHLLPQAKPQLVQCIRDSDTNLVNNEPDYLQYTVGDVITVLNNRPSYMSAMTLWNGVNERGQKGYFEPADTTPYIEIKTINTGTLNTTSKKLTRKESKKSQKPTQRKLNTAMISAPQNDLRHTGHIGYDGAVFGDVSFIGGKYDKLPFKVEAIDGEKVDLKIKTTKEDQSRVASSHTFREDFTGSGDEFDDFKMPDLELDDFKLPDLDNNSDFGVSLMDDIMKVFSDGNKDRSEAVNNEPDTDNGLSDDISSKLDMLDVADKTSSNGIVTNEERLSWNVNETANVGNSNGIVADTNGDVIESSFTFELPNNLNQYEPEINPNLGAANGATCSESTGISEVAQYTYNIDLTPIESQPESNKEAESSISTFTSKFETDYMGTKYADQDVLERYIDSDDESSLKTSPLHYTKNEAVFDIEYASKDKKTSLNNLDSEKTTLEDAIALVEEFQEYNRSQQGALGKQIAESFSSQERAFPETDHESPSLMKMDSYKSDQYDEKQWSTSSAGHERISPTKEPLSPEPLSPKDPVKPHGRSSVTSEEDFSKPLHVNLNIREPQGIPVVRSRSQSSPTEQEQDTNPLRRLRDSRGFVVSKPRPASKPHYLAKSVQGRPTSHRAN